MEILLEIIYEIIFEGLIYIGTRRNVPMVFRILCALLVISFYFGIVGVMLYIGLRENNFVVMFLALALFVIIGLAAYRKYLELRK